MSRTFDQAFSRSLLTLGPRLSISSSGATRQPCFTSRKPGWHADFGNGANSDSNATLEESRTEETCGLNFIDGTDYKNEKCKLCDQIEKKQRRYDRMTQDVERWRKEGNRRAVIEKTEYDMEDVQQA